MKALSAEGREKLRACRRALRFRLRFLDVTTPHWTTGPLPFLSDRARQRAPQILAYAAVTGAAMLISPAGEVVLFRGSAVDVDANSLARLAARAAARADRDVATLAYEGVCVHATALTMGWTLCLISNLGSAPPTVLDRLERAGKAMRLALLDGPPPSGRGSASGSGGAPAEMVLFKRRN